MATTKAGLVLVFDLDQTLIDTEKDFNGIMTSLQDKSLTVEEFIKAIHEKIDPLLNKALIEKVLRPASKLRKTGQVSAILMLSNNSRYSYAANVSYAIQESLDDQSKFHDESNNRFYYFFDYIMIRTHASRNRSKDPNNPPKSIKDVKNMLERLELPTENLEGRTYFFDDIGDHKIRDDFKKAGVEDHYIYIARGNPSSSESSGFSAGFPDKTDYGPVEKALAEASAAPTAAPNVNATPALAPSSANTLSLPCQPNRCVQEGGTRKKRVKRTRRLYKKSKPSKKSRRRLYSLLCKKLNP
jgi:hypothetical protein